MKIKPGYVLRRLDDEALVVPTGESSIHRRHYIRLNESGAVLFEALGEERSEAELIDILQKSYSIEEATAREAVEHFLESLRSHDLLDE